MTVLTEGECFTRLIEYLIKAQEEAAMLGHLANANDKRERARAWLKVSELFKELQHKTTQLAMGKLQ
jgi:hypothetical protein